MTDTRHEQPRCPICRWPYRPGGCTPAQCQNPEPEDVDAELAPKGLPVIELDGPTWVGPWRECGHSYERTIIKARVEADPSLANVIVMLDPDNQWGFWAGLIARTDVWGKGHPTPEAAQQACEAAIVAAWRSR